MTLWTCLRFVYSQEQQNWNKCKQISIYLSIYSSYVKFSMLAQFRRSHE